MSERRRTLRLLVVVPSWVGDAVMATPAFRALRGALPGTFIGALVRPGIDGLLAGLPYFDEVHVERASGVMGPKFVAAKLRPRRYDTALLLTNSFSSALTARIAGIPRRIGYDRDARGLLLTDRKAPARRPGGGFAPVPAVGYYLELAHEFLLGTPVPGPGNAARVLELACTPDDERAAREVLARAGVAPGEAYAVLNPGGNNPAKRWPVDRFAAVGRHLARDHSLRVLVSGSPGERDLVGAVCAGAGGRAADVSAAGITLGSLKAVVRGARLMVTNDTGPRHLAGAFGVPLVTLFGPTDHRWTTITTRPGAPEAILLADPTLPEDQVADDHPDRCRVDRITTEAVVAAADRALSRGS